MTTRTVVTVNLSKPAHSTTKRQQRAALTAIAKAHAPAVIAAQEANAGLRAPAGYSKVQGPGGLCEIPLFVKDTLHVVAHGAHRSVPGRAGHWPDRGFAWVRIADGFTVLNTHLNSGIEQNGQPRRGIAWDAALDHLGELEDVADHLVNFGRVVITADWNIDRRADRAHRAPAFPSKRLDRIGFDEVIYAGGSLGRRAVDRIFYEAEQLVPEVVHVLPKRKAFDHRPVLTRVRFL